KCPASDVGSTPAVDAVPSRFPSVRLTPTRTCRGRRRASWGRPGHWRRSQCPEHAPTRCVVSAVLGVGGRQGELWSSPVVPVPYRNRQVAGTSNTSIRAEHG